MPEFEQHPAAWQEFEEALVYYTAISPELASDFEESVKQCRRRVCSSPLRLRARRFDVRRANLAPRFREWYLAYLLVRSRVVIVAIGHARRRPFYFARRIGQSRQMF